MKHESIGKVYGKLTLVNYVGQNKRHEQLYNCECECGTHKIVKLPNLKLGRTKSCGCLIGGCERENLVGKTFNYLTVIKYLRTTKHRDSIWLCKCKCGKEKEVYRNAMINNHTKSCGCYNVEQKKLLKGILNPNYNVNLTNEERENRRNNEVKEWALNVKRKGYFKCDICSSKKKLHSHHLNGYVCDKENRYNVENGVCLCRKCHLEFHSTYGLKNVTKEQYIKFKQNKNERCNN